MFEAVKSKGSTCEICEHVLLICVQTKPWETFILTVIVQDILLSNIYI